VNDLLKYRNGASSELLEAGVARVAETSSSKIQAPDKHQAPNSNRSAARVAISWCLMLGAFLELGAWSLELFHPT
jgi:hypothetical protein